MFFTEKLERRKNIASHGETLETVVFSIPYVKNPQMIHHAHSIMCFLFGFMIMVDFPDHHFVLNFVFMLKLFLALFRGWSRELRKL